MRDSAEMTTLLTLRARAHVLGADEVESKDAEGPEEGPDPNKGHEDPPASRDNTRCVVVVVVESACDVGLR